MTKTKNWHRYPFIILTVIHTLLLINAFYRARNRKRLLVLLVSNISIAYHFEYFIFNLFNAYRYKPKFFKKNYFDNIFGSILSQAILIPFTAVFVTSFHFGWKVKLLFSLYFSVIECVFKKIRIYDQHWWKTIYTAVLLPIYFRYSDKWYYFMQQDNRIVRHSSLYHMILVLNVNSLFALAVKKNIKFGRGSHHTWNDHFKIAPIYAIIKSLCITILINNIYRFRASSAFIFVSLLDYSIYKWKIVKIHDVITYFFIINPFIIYCSISFHKLVSTVNEGKSV